MPLDADRGGTGNTGLWFGIKCCGSFASDICWRGVAVTTPAPPAAAVVVMVGAVSVTVAPAAIDGVDADLNVLCGYFFRMSEQQKNREPECCRRKSHEKKW